MHGSGKGSRKIGMFADSVFMLRPDHFGFNAETATSNEFQNRTNADPSQVDKEFLSVVEALAGSGIRVDVLPDDQIAINPDALFLNNWFSTHRDGTLVIYPMHSRSRQREVRQDLIAYFQEMYEISSVADLREVADGSALEGTGSMVFDRANGSAFLTPSVRSTVALGLAVTKDLGFHLVPLKALSQSGQPLYHTNVVIAVGSGFLLACPQSLENPGILEEYCSRMGLEWIKLSPDQLESSFAANGLQLVNQKGDPVFVMSAAARKSLSDDQVARLEKHTSIVSAGIPLIEKVGGGSIRCMLAECFWKARRVAESVESSIE